MRRATVLDELATAAVGRAEELRSSTDLTALYQEALLFEKRDFAGALSAPGLSVISEIKRASPSAGFIREADPAEWGARYESGGRELSLRPHRARALQGSLEDLDAARGDTTLPVLAQRLHRRRGPDPGDRNQGRCRPAHSGALRRGGARPLRLSGRRGRSYAARGDPRRGRGEPRPRVGRERDRGQQPQPQRFHRGPHHLRTPRARSWPAPPSSPRAASRAPKTPDACATPARTRYWWGGGDAGPGSRRRVWRPCPEGRYVVGRSRLRRTLKPSRSDQARLSVKRKSEP